MVKGWLDSLPKITSQAPCPVGTAATVTFPDLRGVPGWRTANAETAELAALILSVIFQPHKAFPSSTCIIFAYVSKKQSKANTSLKLPDGGPLAHRAASRVS